MPLDHERFREVTWDEVRLEVKKLAPDIFEAIEVMSPDKTYKLYEVNYRYGADIVGDQAIFTLPGTQDNIPINSEELKATIKNELNYDSNGMPFGIVLDGSVQLSFFEPNTRLRPSSIFTAGSITALRRVLDLPQKYQVNYYRRMHSGARTAYLLADMADRKKFARLCRYFDLDLDPPNSLTDQWTLFKALANAPKFSHPWQTRLLLFGKKWVNVLPKNASLRLALLDRVWQLTSHERIYPFFNEIWHDFTQTIRNKKVDAYVLAMAKHIFDASLGNVFSFEPVVKQLSDNQNDIGPFMSISECLIDVYDLKKYAPIIMTPIKYNENEHKNAFVSIRLPTINLERRYLSKNNFLMADLREIAYVIDKFSKSIRQEVLRDLPIYDLGRFSYKIYSADKGQQSMFLPAATIFDADILKNYPATNQLVNIKNDFLRACVKIDTIGATNNKMEY